MGFFFYFTHVVQKVHSRFLLFSFYFSFHSYSSPQTAGRSGIECFRHGWRFGFSDFFHFSFTVSPWKGGQVSRRHVILATKLILAGVAVGKAERDL
jgi:hypothetical protein